MLRANFGPLGFIHFLHLWLCTTQNTLKYVFLSNRISLVSLPGNIKISTLDFIRFIYYLNSNIFKARLVENFIPNSPKAFFAVLVSKRNHLKTSYRGPFFLFFKKHGFFKLFLRKKAKGIPVLFSKVVKYFKLFGASLQKPFIHSYIKWGLKSYISFLKVIPGNFSLVFFEKKLRFLLSLRLYKKILINKIAPITFDKFIKYLIFGGMKNGRNFLKKLFQENNPLSF